MALCATLSSYLDCLALPLHPNSSAELRGAKTGTGLGESLNLFQPSFREILK